MAGEAGTSAVVRTDAGMCAVWRPEHFTAVDTLDAWEDEVAEDGALTGHIVAGALVPLNVGGDGAFQVTIRLGGPTAREERYVLVSSQPYLLVSEGTLALGGLENVGSYVGGATMLPMPAARYAVTVHLIDWKAEPGAVTADGQPAESALPDFLVTLAAETVPTTYRSSVQTFDRS